MAAVLLACLSAFFFGATMVAMRLAFRRTDDARTGAVVVNVAALAVTLPWLAVAPGGTLALGALWPWFLAGLLAPGASQVLISIAVREVGASRTSVVVGTAPLVSVTIALVALDEPLRAPLLAGAVLIVAGGVLLALERGRPAHLRAVGLALAFAATAIFASRDNLIRHLSLETDAAPAAAAVATLAGGILVTGVFAVASGRPGRAVAAFVPAGVIVGLSYIAMFEAYYRGRVSVVSPLIATESLWGVLLSGLVLGRSELIGRRLVAGAVLVVAGSALIGAFR